MRTIYCLAFLIFVLHPLCAQELSVNNELKALIQQGFDYFPQLKEAEQQSHNQEISVGIHQGARRPVVSGNAEYNYIYPISQIHFAFPGMESSILKFVPRHNVNTYLNLNYALLDFGRVKANVQKAKEQLQQSRYNTDLTKSQLAAQLANIYYGIIYTREALAIQDTVIQFLNESRKVTESKFRHGDALEIDTLNIRASIDREENVKIDLENMLQKNIFLLLYSTGKDSLEGKGHFDFRYNNTNKEEILQMAIRQHPEFMLAQARILIAESDLKISKMALRPTLMFSAKTGFRNGYFPNIYQTRFNYAVGGTFMFPLYDGGRFRQGINLGRNMVRTQQLSLNTLQNTYQKDIAQALSDLHSAQAHLKNVEIQILQAKANQRLAASMYKNGVATYLDLNSANSNFQRTVLSKAQYQFQLCQAYIELARLAGVKYWE
jgi:outer membrane protein